MLWVFAAFFSAIFTSCAALISKQGLHRSDSTLTTALRTYLVLVCAIGMAACAGSLGEIVNIDAFSLTFMILSGISTACCSVCYFKALTLGSVNKVLPIEKSSIVITLLFAIFYFGESSNLGLKLLGIALIAAGMPLLIAKESAAGKKLTAKSAKQHLEPTLPHFYAYAVGAALFAALNTIFSKIGIRGIESNLATAINTVLEAAVLTLWVSVERKWGKIREIPRSEWMAVLLSGLATGGSWICYYYAVKMGALTVVVPLNKLSVPFTALFSHFILHEYISVKMGVGLALIVAGMMLVVMLG